MKRILTVVTLLGAMAVSYGQGTVKFLNDGTTLINYKADQAASPAALPATANQFYFALFTAPVGTTNPDLFNYAGFIGANQAVAGRFSGGVVAIPNNPAGSHLAMLVRGWSANAGTTWAAALAFKNNPTDNYNWGTSGIAADVTLGGGPTPAGTIFSTVNANATPGLTLDFVPVPEPSTFALAGLGAAALLIFRRRK
jgi:hypothetical protein